MHILEELILQTEKPTHAQKRKKRRNNNKKFRKINVLEYFKIQFKLVRRLVRRLLRSPFAPSPGL